MRPIAAGSDGAGFEDAGEVAAGLELGVAGSTAFATGGDMKFDGDIPSPGLDASLPAAFCTGPEEAAFS
jgi:hypothetical protein